MMRLQRMENVTGLTEQLYARIMAEHGPSCDETIHPKSGSWSRMILASEVSVRLLRAGSGRL
jgi:hypothetical protein